MRKLNDVLKKTGVEIYREITAVALYSMITSLVLVTVVMFVPLWTALVPRRFCTCRCFTEFVMRITAERNGASRDSRMCFKVRLRD